MVSVRLATIVLVPMVLASQSLLGAQLFHNGGTGECSGCHNTPPQLKGSDPGSTCLNCHQAPFGVQLPEGIYVATDPMTVSNCVQLPPGGDFCWLKKNYKWNVFGSQEVSRGDKHGHNIVAQDYGYMADPTLPTAPGGVYPSNSMSCISCHDPHGNYRRNADGTISASGIAIVASGSYNSSPDPSSSGTVGSYRLLAGKGYQPKSLGVGVVFTADPPAAVAPLSYNRSEALTETRVAYGSGMSEWCQNCHAGSFSKVIHHPAGSSERLTMELVQNYNSYVATGNLNGNRNTSYTSLVPFEMGTRDYGLLKRTANTTNSEMSGPKSDAVVMCLTCHRAHASGWDSINRWNNKSTFIVYDNLYPGIDNSVPLEFSQGRSEIETQKTFYDRPTKLFSPFQRSLCNKCHVKD